MAWVFLDASAMIPMQLTRDQWRRDLDRVMAGLRRAGQPDFVTSNWTLYEALAQVRRSSFQLARELQDWVTLTVAVAPVRPVVEREALSRFLSRPDQSASVVDHASLLVAQEWDCDAILSFDADFIPLIQGTGMRLLR
ncbi:MAG: PIN domain-containing protein [Dehalococcoidia bacterium]